MSWFANEFILNRKKKKFKIRKEWKRKRKYSNSARFSRHEWKMTATRQDTGRRRRCRGTKRKKKIWVSVETKEAKRVRRLSGDFVLSFTHSCLFTLRKAWGGRKVNSSCFIKVKKIRNLLFTPSIFSRMEGNTHELWLRPPCSTKKREKKEEKRCRISV